MPQETSPRIVSQRLDRARTAYNTYRDAGDIATGNIHDLIADLLLLNAYHCDTPAAPYIDRTLQRARATYDLHAVHLHR